MKGTTYQELVRIAEHAGVQPTHIVSFALFKDTDPANVEVLIEDGVAYFTEKR